MECHTDWHVVAYRRTTHGYTGVYRHLRSLEGHGLIRRTIRDGRKRVCWTLVEQTALPDPAAATTAVSDRGELVDDDASEEPQTASAHMVAC